MEVRVVDLCIFACEYLNKAFYPNVALNKADGVLFQGLSFLDSEKPFGHSLDFFQKKPPVSVS